MNVKFWRHGYIIYIIIIICIYILTWNDYTIKGDGISCIVFRCTGCAERFAGMYGRCSNGVK